MDRDHEIAALAISPHFDAVRDVFSEYEPEPGVLLYKVRRVKFVVSERARKGKRGFAACRDDGLEIVVAPQAADEIELEMLVAILAHEFGHACDFLYPGQWKCAKDTPAVWAPGIGASSRSLHRWARRNPDQVEWDADSIAWSVTGHRIQYCGDCMLQCFSRGVGRPDGLR
jgi:hypothetical protein